jgi:regulator of protease activity HflC (stomatin/prohibitin superfamily)
MNRLGFIVSSILFLLALASSTLFVVDQRQFGVVLAFGQIKNVITQPGLNFKLPPPFQNVSYIDKRLLTLDSTDNEPMLTAEKQRVVIDWFVRWRISEPTEYIRNVGTNEGAGASQLNRVVRNAFQEAFQASAAFRRCTTRKNGEGTGPRSDWREGPCGHQARAEAPPCRPQGASWQARQDDPRACG